MSTMKYWALIVLFALAGCGSSEEHVISRYLGAVQQGEDKIAAAMSLATFPGEVQSWEVLEAGPETKEPFRFKELHQQALDAQKAFDAAIEANNAFATDHSDLAGQYRSKIDQDPDYKFESGEIAEFQQEWERRMEEQKKLQDAARQAEEAFEQLKAAARMSVNVGVTEHYEGDESVKKVNVRVDDGSGPKTYTFTLRKYNVADTENNITPIANWIITDIAPQEGQDT